MEKYNDILETIQKEGKEGVMELSTHLSDYPDKLEIETPSIFGNKLLLKSERESKPRINRREGKTAKFRPAHQEVFENRDTKQNLWSIVKMLFPEVPGLQPMHINLIDTIFYLSDGAMVYILTDQQKGLIKIKNKNNFYELFLRRKQEIDKSQKNGSLSISTIGGKSPNSSGVFHEDEHLSYFKHLNYVALLRYKDDNFIRLKQHEFKSIFSRPVQANQKYKHFNNTQYIQVIPNDINFEENTIISLHFDAQKFRKSILFEKVQDLYYTHANRVASVALGIREKLKKISVQLFLYFQIFQIYAYMNLHYHIKILEASFEFMRLNNHDYYLSNIHNIRLNQHPDNKLELFRKNIFQSCSKKNEEEKQSIENFISSDLIQEVSQYFDKRNTQITQNVTEFIKEKFTQIKNLPDVEESKTIFSSINPSCNVDFHSLLKNRTLYGQFLRKKQQQMDGFSKLNSMSNIARKGRNKTINSLEVDKKVIKRKILKSNTEQRNPIKIEKKSSRKNIRLTFTHYNNFKN